MAECIAHVVRYDTRRETGETRREYNEKFGHPTPTITIPEDLQYLWEWFFDLSDMVDRAGDGFCKPITAQDYLGWQMITGNIVSPEDYAILKRMDVAYTAEMTKEIHDSRTRQQQQSELNAANRRNK